ncbi:MAG TPA: M23 family metallopeptidase [bacterium]|nr:M23 family metallopeptidase [bacterium]
MSPKLRSYFRKKMTFMVVPHDGGKPYQLKTHLFLVQSMALLFIGLLALAGYVVSRHVDYELARLTQKKFESNMRDILKEVDTNRSILGRISLMDSQFRKLLKLGDKKEVVSQFAGMGGPTEEESARFSQLLQEKNDELARKVEANLKLTHQQAVKQEASFKEISSYLNKQSSILAATPSLWPVKGWITSGFGRRASPLTGEPGRHMGVDIANEVNTPIRAAADGIVTYAGWEAGYGRLVAIEHGYGYSTRYGHCARIEVKVGDEVKRGQVVGYMGSTGHSTGSHVHYEVRVHGVPVDPEKYLPKVD